MNDIRELKRLIGIAEETIGEARALYFIDEANLGDADDLLAEVQKDLGELARS